MRQTRVRCAAAALVALTIGASADLQAWGSQGHRLVALLAAERLTPVARRNIVWLLGPESLADVASWADRYHDGAYQTFYWHFVNIPPGATGYDRDRDCRGSPVLLPALVPTPGAIARWIGSSTTRRGSPTPLSIGRIARSP